MDYVSNNKKVTMGANPTSHGSYIFTYTLYINIHTIWTCIVHIHTYIHTYIHKYIHTSMHTYIHYIYIYLHTYTHTIYSFIFLYMYIYTYTHTIWRFPEIGRPFFVQFSIQFTPWWGHHSGRGRWREWTNGLSIER